jgi:hypothetical protein
MLITFPFLVQFKWLQVLYERNLMIYKSSLNHKGNRPTFKDVFGCLVIVLDVCGGFWFPPFDTPPPPTTLEGRIWLISSSFSTIQLSVGVQIVGLQFLFGHEIQSTLQKFVDHWDTKCLVTGLATLILIKLARSAPPCLQKETCIANYYSTRMDLATICRIINYNSKLYFGSWFFNSEIFDDYSL